MITFRKLRHSFGGAPLLDEASLSLQSGERACLVGRNGTGKSTLLKIVAGELAPDDGEIETSPGYRIRYLPQEIPMPELEAVGAIVASGLEGLDLPEWEADNRLEQILEDMDLPAQALYRELSAGWRRRVLLARALIAEPDLLLLDEPTNHLDLAAIRWIEKYLLSFSGALLFVTHDRAFLRNLATRILDLDRGRLSSWDCDYPTYLTRKENLLEAEARQQAVFDKKLAEEESWLRQGIKARRTRNEGRVRALLKMRGERQARRDRSGSVRLGMEDAGQTGHKVITAENLAFSWEGRPILHGFSTEILRGDKIGILGPNGVGKSTLLRLLLGQLPPNQGTVTHGTNLRIAYFDQTRQQLDEQATLREVVADGNEVVEINGQRKHVVGYLRDFLFPADRAQSTVSMLSGGERNRLLLARLFARPFNVLVMDEPTNDLDIETLELLEDKLAEFSGVLLLVSHDRAFLDNIVTYLYVMEGDGQVHTVFGGTAEAEADAARRQAAQKLAAQKTSRQSETDHRDLPAPPSSPVPGNSPAPVAANSSSPVSGNSPAVAANSRSPVSGKSAPVAANSRSPVPGNSPAVAANSRSPVSGKSPAKPRRFLNRERWELERLPAEIEALEAENEQLVAQLADPALYQNNPAQLPALQTRIHQIEAEIEAKLHRWEELDNLQKTLE